MECDIQESKRQSEINALYDQFIILNSEKDSSRRQAMRNKLLSSVFLYVKEAFGKDSAQSNGLEITDTVISCLKAYHRGSDTPFSTYLDVSLRKMLKKEKTKRLIENSRGGILIPDKKDRQIRKILSTAERMGKNTDDPAVRHWLADTLSMTIDEIDKYLEINQIATVTKETDLKNEDDFGPFDLISSDYENPDARFHKSDSSKAEILSHFYIMQEYWESRQERSKNLYSLLITFLILSSREVEIFCQYRGEIQVLTDVIREKHFSFVDKNLLNIFLSGQGWPDQNTLADRAGTDKTNVSRVMKKIKKDLKEMSTQATS